MKIICSVNNFHVEFAATLADSTLVRKCPWKNNELEYQTQVYVVFIQNNNRYHKSKINQTLQNDTRVTT